MSSSLLSDLVDFNPPRQLERGEKAKFVEMASLPIAARNVERIQVKEYKGSGSRFRNGDTLLARITPCLENGKTAKMNGLEKGEHAFGSTEFIVLAAKDAAIDEDFLYYLARHPSFRSFAIARMEGTSGRQRVSWQSVSGFRFCFPSPNVRKTAGDILRGLDDKIELNRRMNRTLEAMAQAIFKSWFVDFEPVKAKAAAKSAGASPEEIERTAMAAIAGKTEAELDQLPKPQQQCLARTAALFPDTFQESELGEIPEGWSPSPMNSLCTLNPESWTKKNHPDTVDYVDLANTKNGQIQETQLYDWNIAPSRARRILKGGDTIVGTVRPGNRSFAFVHETGDQLTASTGFAVLRPRESYLREFNNIALTSDSNIERLTQLADGAAYPAVRPDVVASFSLAMPNKILLKLFSTIVWPMFDLSEKNSNQTRTLAQLRDILLPKLLSGELNVPEAN